MNIYLDHNILIDINKARMQGDSTEWDALLSGLASLSARPVLSAWHMVENSKAKIDNERQAYNAMIAELSPRYLSNNNYVKEQELIRYLFKVGRWMEDGDNRAPFHDSVASMWSSYGGTVFIGEEFGDFVERLAREPETGRPINSALEETPDLIKDARNAIKDDPSLLKHETIVDHAWILSHLPERDSHGKFVNLQYRKLAAQFAAENLADVFKVCPAVFVDELRYRNALRTNFKVRATDAADTQHVVLALAYCDAIVTNDRPLHTFVKSSGTTCKPARHINEISVT